MPIESRQESEGRGARDAAVARATLRRGSSRMLESYLGDVEYLMREQQWPQAATLALALPHICAALEDGDLKSSRESYRRWCEVWVRPPKSDTTLTMPSASELLRMAEQYAVERELADSGGIPSRALRELRLRRLARAAPARRRVSLKEMGELGDEPAREACVALIDAVRRWYGDYAALDPHVQMNLARLAVLR